MKIKTGKKTMSSTLIILTRNEINGVISQLNKIPFSLFDEFFAIDYRSTDGTVEYFQKNNIPVIKQKRPGRAEAFNLGVRKSRGTYLVFFSPDGNEDPSDIYKLYKLLKNGFDLAIASRFLPHSRNEEDGKIFKFRAWANQGFTFLANLFWNGHVTDSINGYRAITKVAYNKLHLDAKGFAVEFQMTIRALKLGMKIIEIPTKEGDRIGGSSTSYAVPTGIKFLYYLIRELWIGKRF